ncbi:hypothetical protein E2320_003310, partial [Naja naja]
GISVAMALQMWP